MQKIQEFKQWAKENIGVDDHDLEAANSSQDGGEFRFRKPVVQQAYERWLHGQTVVNP